MEELRADVVECWLEARLALGEARAVVSEAEAAIAEHPLREGLWAKLMTALYLSGRQADALRAYVRLRDLLGEELGITPSPELVLLEGAILRQELAPGRSRAGQLADAMPAWEKRTNLPPELTSFIPRPSELTTVTTLLDEPGLLTLTGTGGTGKTRLALQAAREAEATFDGVWLCELAPLTDPADVVTELAAAVGCKAQVGVDLVLTITQHLADGTQLVILDNCEHLIESSAALVEQLLRAVPRLRVLATSRSPLGLAGEVLHRVPTMSVPEEGSAMEGLLDFESVRLFVVRSTGQQPAFTLDSDNCRAVASICVRLDGIPLALELAAARMRTLSVSDIEHHLDDRFRLLTSGARTAPARQQTLRSLIDWSYDLLQAAERTALGRLSIFAGDFDLAAAERVASCDTI
jgi:hypothetical protein